MQPVFENDAFLIVDKPPGWLTIPGRMGEKDPRPVLHTAWQEKQGHRIFIVHRLDAEVSGLVVFAKTAESHREASMWFEHHEVRKTYEAWSEIPTTPPGAREEIWECVLAKGKKRAFEAPHGKPCKTLSRYLGSLIWRDREIAQWSLMPLTGRTHQLRFEMYRHGHSIIGDSLYGSNQSFFPNAIALRAVKLDFSGCVSPAAATLPKRIEIKGVRDYFVSSGDHA